MNFGNDAGETGEGAAKAGLVIAGVGVTTSLVGLPGEPVAVAGAVWAGAGELAWGAGIVLRLAGGAILSVEGNSQPFQSAAVDMAQSQFDDNIHLPSGMPSPAQPLADAMSGENPCP